MKKILPLLGLGCIGVFLAYSPQKMIDQGRSIDQLRNLYSSTDRTQWPAPSVDQHILDAGFEDIGSLGMFRFLVTTPIR